MFKPFRSHVTFVFLLVENLHTNVNLSIPVRSADSNFVAWLSVFLNKVFKYAVY